jgi:hypothetical protein
LDELTRRIAAKSSPKTKAGTGVEPSPSSTPATEAEATPETEAEAAHGPDGECALPSSLMQAIEAEATREPNGRTRTDEELAHQIAGKSSQLTKATKSGALHPTARELAHGIAQAGREGRIKAWRVNNRARDFDPVEQPDGNWLTCCPAHDDHTPSLVMSDSVGKNGKHKLLIHCRAGCKQDKLRGAQRARLVGPAAWNH